MKNYKIIKERGNYKILVWGYDTKGILWWKKKVWQWYNTNIWGGILQIWPIVQPPSDYFKKLKDAKKCVKNWTNQE